MVWSSIPVPASEVALAVAGVPMLVASNAVEYTGQADPIWSIPATFTGSDITDPAAPTRAVRDRHLHVRSRALQQTPAAFTVSLVMRLDPAKPFDTFFLAGHNFNSIASSGSVFLELQIADDPTFAVALATIATHTVADNRRLTRLTLFHTGSSALRYSGVAYARLRISAIGVGATFTSMPSIGEIVLGLRRQLERNPTVPYDNNELASDITTFRSKSGIVSNYERFVAQRRVAATFSTDTTSNLNTINAWFSDAGYGLRPGLWIEVLEGGFFVQSYWMRSPSALTLPMQGPFERTWDLELEEIAPFLLTEPL